MAETIYSRVTRLEKAMIQMAQSQTKFQTRVDKTLIRLDNAMAHLAEVQAAGEKEMRRMKQEALEREKRIDERIEKLVSAIGEFIRRQDGGQREGG